MIFRKKKAKINLALVNCIRLSCAIKFHKMRVNVNSIDWICRANNGHASTTYNKICIHLLRNKLKWSQNTLLYTLYIGITICTRLFTCWLSVISGGSKCHQPEQCLQKHYRELGFPIFQNSRFNLRNKASRKSLVKITRLTHLLFSNTLLCNNLFLCCACIGPDVGWPAFVKLCRITIYLIQ